MVSALPLFTDSRQPLSGIVSALVVQYHSVANFNSFNSFNS